MKWGTLKSNSSRTSSAIILFQDKRSAVPNKFTNSLDLMPVIQNIRGLWRIPVLPRQCVNSIISTDFEHSSTLWTVVGLADQYIFVMSPSTLWSDFVRNCEGNTSSGSSWVVAIIGDIDRDSVEEKSLS